MVNYNHRKFKVVTNSENGEISDDVIFHYTQKGNILSCDYRGRSIKKGLLIGLVDADGRIKMSYQQVNKKGELMTGICSSKPEVLSNGKIRLIENWQWTLGDQSKGTSILEEL